MTNIKDVARQAGVSASTVSRVLAGKNCVNPETRRKVLEAARALDYSPNVLAKGLKMRRSNTIALMVPSIENEIFPTIARGVEDTARKSGYTVILCNTYEDVDVEQAYINKLRTRWIDGFIVASMLPDSHHIRSLWEDGFPVVLLSRYYNDPVDAVVVDNVQAAYDAVQYLIRCGHRRIALALGREELPFYADRWAGYRAALADNGLPYDQRLVLHETNGTSGFYQLTKQLVGGPLKPDAIFATSDPKAVVVMRALHDCGLNIPDDISVIGFDNTYISSMIEPPLSTVSQPLYAMGVAAAKRLIRRIRSREDKLQPEPPCLEVLPTDLIIRKSTR